MVGDTSTNMLAKAEAEISKAYMMKTVSPALTAILVELAISLLVGCLKRNKFKEGDFKKTIIAHPIRSRIWIRRQMRASGLLGREDADVIVETLMRAAEDAEEMDLHNLATQEDFLME